MGRSRTQPRLSLKPGRNDRYGVPPIRGMRPSGETVPPHTNGTSHHPLALFRFHIANDGLLAVVYMDMLHPNELLPAIAQPPEYLDLSRVSTP